MVSLETMHVTQTTYTKQIVCIFYIFLCLKKINPKRINRPTKFMRFTHPPRMFLSTNFLFEKRIGEVTMELFYIRLFIYYIKNNQQKYSMLSNYFSLRCFGRGWIVCFFLSCSTFRFKFKWQLLCKFCTAERNFLLISCFYSYFYKTV